MTKSLLDPQMSLAAQNERLLKITEALMNRVEQASDESGAAYTQFQRAALLEEEVAARTKDLERALDLLNVSNAALAQANQETEAARSNLANALEAIQEGFALFDAQDILVMCNSRFGMHMPDIHEHFEAGLSFQDYVTLASQSPFLSLPKNMTSEEWAQNRIAQHKEPHVIINIRMIWNRWVQVSEHRTPDGGTAILQTDVTDIMRLQRQERERMLDDQAQLIRATLEHLNQGICIFDNNMRLVGWNSRIAELLPISINKAQMGTSFESLLDNLRSKVRFGVTTSPNDLQNWVDRKHDRPPLSFELSHGRDTVLDVFAQEMPDKGFVISFTDVSSERKAVRAIYEAKETLEQRVFERTLELEDALTDAERANTSKSRFVAAASHDLLQPLSAAKLYLSSLESTAQDADTRDILGKANRAMLSVENILEALLDISKLDSGKASVHIAPVSLGRMLEQLKEEFQPLAIQKGLELRIFIPEDHVMSDATYLRRILQNLIANAIRYTERGRVVVGPRRSGNSLRIEVWDTGPGIPEDQQDIIFGEFQRLNASASAAEGMGLGLAIVERACAILNHPLHIESNLGKGTCFKVELPKAHPERRPKSTKHQFHRRIAPQNFQNTIVLLIENDIDLRDALSNTLESWGIDVLTSASGSEAQELLTEIDITPDIILADYQLDNQETGTDAIRSLRNGHGLVPAAILTANRAPNVIKECDDQELTLFYKPIAPDHLKSFLSASIKTT